MRIIIPIFILIALALLIYNITRINFDAPFAGDSSIALIGVVGSACAIVLLLILYLSRKIAKKQKGK